MANIYFDLTREFNARGTIAILASGQAVVYYRLAMMSKDGDWIVKETGDACGTILAVLDRHQARYRPGAPLDPRWLSGGWSSHFEFFDDRRRRIRCDFFSRPPKVAAAARDDLFATASEDPLAVIGIEDLILMKRTQSAKDYAVIGELARRLPPAREIEFTTDVDRLCELAPGFTTGSQRPTARVALEGPRDSVVVALARETDQLQQADHQRLRRYEAAAREYLAAFRKADIQDGPLAAAHETACRLAEECLPRDPLGLQG